MCRNMLMARLMLTANLLIGHVNPRRTLYLALHCVCHPETEMKNLMCPSFKPVYEHYCLAGRNRYSSISTYISGQTLSQEGLLIAVGTSV